MAEGDVLDLQLIAEPSLTDQAADEVTLQFIGDPSPGAWLCAVDMDPADDALGIMAVVTSTPWTLALKSANEGDTTEEPIESHTLGDSRRSQRKSS
jgi:hypothetical protein